MKKIISFLLSMVMVTSMSISAFAQTSFDDFEHYQLYEISDMEKYIRLINL